jgi:CheY-specific phosphatase CheX
MTTQPLQPNVVHSFTEVVLRCLRTTVGIDAVVAAAGESQSTAPSIAVALDFGGDVRGPVTWVFPPAIALELVRRLMDDPSPSPDSAADGATELANILTGHASQALESHGFRCELGAPRMHVGALPIGVVVHMTTDSGPIDLVLSLSSDAA